MRILVLGVFLSGCGGPTCRDGAVELDGECVVRETAPLSAETGDTGSGACFDADFMIMEWFYGWDANTQTTVPVTFAGEPTRSAINIHVFEEVPGFDVDAGDWMFNEHCTVTYYLDDLPASPDLPVGPEQWMGLRGVDADDAWTDCDEWACAGKFSEFGAVRHFAQWTFDLEMGGPIDDYVMGLMPSAFEPVANHWGGSLGGGILGGPRYDVVAHGFQMSGGGPWTVDEAAPLSREQAWPTAGNGGPLATGYYVTLSPWYFEIY